MISKNNPKKITLGMMKGKSITTSVPSIKYHASDDELEELYSEEESEASPKCSPIKKLDDSESFEGNLERRSTSMDENLSEGMPPSDTWKLLLDIRGKITKTFEDKISEIKSEKKKKKKRRRQEVASVSDSENFEDITPVEDFNSEKQNKESFSPLLRRRVNSSRFTFHEIETGLKTKVYEEKSIESGVEAVELFEDIVSKTNLPKESEISKVGINVKDFCFRIFKTTNTEPTEIEHILRQFLNLLLYKLFILICTLLVLWIAPVSDIIKGICLGIFVSFSYRKTYCQIQQVLQTPPKKKSIIEIPAVEEFAVLDKFEGWLNELPYDYKPENYHVARTKSVFLKLEGDVLQILETKSRIPKRAVWDEPNHKVKFTKKRIYSLSGSSIELLPLALIRRRRWSKKYPICITLLKEALIEYNFLKNSSDDETQQTENKNDKIIVEAEGEQEEEDEEEETDDELSQSKEIKDVFEDSKEEFEDLKHKIFIFARTDRQKEDWYRQLSLSAKLGSKRSSISSAKDLSLSQNLLPTTLPNETKNSSNFFFEISPDSYMTYMSRYTEPNSSLPLNDQVWINALLGRLIFDLHKCPNMINVIQDKIQRKLSNIKLPYFMESLLVSELMIGQNAPVIHNATKPVLDGRGLWFDLDISYEGCFTMTIETKLNLMKLKRAGSLSVNSNANNSNNSNDISESDKSLPARSPVYCSDVEDSPETSTEDEDNGQFASPSVSRESTPTQSSGRKFLSMMDKLASSKYFQSATELSYVRRAMEGVSNTEIKLMVSVSSIQGCLAVNLPPSPSDRLWYGFKPVPKISLTAKPALGEKKFDIVYLTQWIETKLLREFEKIVVIPNMDDLLIPLCPNYPYA
ncbi:testis-expressed protein 2 [Leptopilina heterotoma]|uniref:testis-expressed protein 2 n=1 Tax=Leptopilina heterotoma TaxID=63436 RepID=UPI001CA9D3B9|nr:testis-expressed protein 2 [Leptopilina heterotoma]